MVKSIFICFSICRVSINSNVLFMKCFIEVTNKKQGMKQLVNLNKVESFTPLTNETLIHFSFNNTVTVNESYGEIKELIKQAK